MISQDPDRQTTPAPCSNGLFKVDDPQATASYPPADLSPQRAKVVDSQSTSRERFDFLSPPRAAGEYGWLGSVSRSDAVWAKVAWALFSWPKTAFSPDPSP